MTSPPRTIAKSRSKPAHSLIFALSRPPRNVTLRACAIGPTAAGEAVSPLFWAIMLALWDSGFYNRSKGPQLP
jgi:hypothetical protein